MASGNNDEPVLIDEVGGFLSEKNIRVYGNATITGDGTRYRPLQLSTIARTGTYQPVIGLVDNDNIPISGNTKGDRYVSKEKDSSFGLLYPLDGVIALQKRLEEIGSEWRVPSKKDWDQLLNMVEDCSQDKNHDDETNPSNVYLGVNAGAYLKSNLFWEPIYRKIPSDEDFVEGERFNLNENGEFVPNENGEYVKEFHSDDRYGFSIYPVGFGERRGISTIGGFGKWAAFWTTSEEDTRDDMFVKVFSNDKRGVEQNTWGRDCYLSIRLVKNYNGSNLNEVEDIDGKPMPTLYIDVKDIDRKKYDTTLIWTQENVGFTNKEYGGVVSKEWEEHASKLSKEKFYINDWDGTKWVKHELREGESVVMFEHNGVRMHEWRLVNGEFIDTSDIIKNEFSKELAELDSYIKILAGKLNSTDERISQEIGDRISGDELLQKNLETEIKSLKETDEILFEKINGAYEKLSQENADRISGDELLQKNLETEIAARIDADAAITLKIDSIETLINGETKNLNDSITSLVNRVTDAEEDIVGLDNRMSVAESNVTANALAITAIDEAYKASDEGISKKVEENKVYPTDDTIVVDKPSTNGTGISVKIPEMGMVKSDVDGLYFDGDYSFGGNLIKNITE